MTDALPDHPDASRRTPTDEHVYASFTLCGAEFAIDVAHVQEVVNAPPRIVPMPLAPAHALGVFDLRGRIVPVLDMRRMLGLPEAGDGATADYKIAVIAHHGVRLGLRFDDTRRVLRPAPGECTALEYEPDSAHGVVAGVLSVGGDLIRVLDPARLGQLRDVPHAPDADGFLAERTRRRRTRCVVFRVGGMRLAFGIAGIHEIVAAGRLDPSPIPAPLVLGVTRVRGRLVPVVGCAALLGMGVPDGRTQPAAADGSERIITLDCGDGLIGLWVDDVESIDTYFEEDLLRVPPLQAARVGLFAGCLDMGARGHVFVLDSAGVVAQPELAMVGSQFRKLFEAESGARAGASARGSIRRPFLWIEAAQPFALAMASVREIVDANERLIAMPGAQAGVPGMVNLRGRMVTVVDMRTFYGLPARADGARAGTGHDAKIIVLDRGDEMVGVLVDAVRSIVHVDQASRMAVPDLLRRSLPASVRHDVREVLQARDGEHGHTHLLLLDAGRVFDALSAAEPPDDGGTDGSGRTAAPPARGAAAGERSRSPAGTITETETA